MDILNVILLSLFSLIALFILTKLMGYRQMSEMSMFDYINGITIGSIAAEMATSLEKDWWLPLTAMVVYALAAIVLSYISVKSMAARRVISGKPLILMDHDTIYEKNLLKGKIDFIRNAAAMPGQRLFQFVGSADNHTGTQWPYEFPSKIRQTSRHSRRYVYDS